VYLLFHLLPVTGSIPNLFLKAIRKFGFNSQRYRNLLLASPDRSSSNNQARSFAIFFAAMTSGSCFGSTLMPAPARAPVHGCCGPAIIAVVPRGRQAARGITLGRDTNFVLVDSIRARTHTTKRSPVRSYDPPVASHRCSLARTSDHSSHMRKARSCN